jgi:type II secretory pathway pseudopilin PulG
MNQRGFTLLEMLVYMVGLTVVLTAAYPAFEKAMRGSRDIQRNSDDILRAIHAGELWRKDVRSATGSLHLDGNALVIPQSSGPIVYRFADGAVWRETGAGRNMFLRAVKASSMRSGFATVTFWRWEVELASPQKNPPVRPLFTFEAVP